MDNVKYYVSDLIKDMLDEIKGASKYLDMAKSSMLIDQKKMFVEMASQELKHYEDLCSVLKEKMTSHPNEVTLDNNIIAKTLFEDMKGWKERVHGHVKAMADELGVKI